MIIKTKSQRRASGGLSNNEDRGVKQLYVLGDVRLQHAFRVMRVLGTRSLGGSLSQRQPRNGLPGT